MYFKQAMYKMLVVCTLKFKVRSLASSCLLVRPSVGMKQLGTPCKDFHEICNIREFFKICQKIQLTLQFETNNDYFTRRQI